VPTLDLASEVALIHWAAQAAGRASLVHDVAEGGLAVALAEAALWSGVGLQLDGRVEPEATPLSPLELFGEVGGQVLSALPADQVEVDPTGAEVEVRRLGTVGGDDVLGVPLATLRDAYEGSD
jgi:phosphoribosylformylglycinamidine synthase